MAGRWRRSAAGAVVLAALVAGVATRAPDSLRVGAADAGGETPVVLAVIGDAGGFNPDVALVAGLVAGWNPDAVITMGDNIYPMSSRIKGTNRFDLAVGKYYCRFLAGAASGPNCPGNQSAVNRFFPATGNHDYSDGGIANYRAYFTLPGTGVVSQRTSGSELYYDVVRGPVHFFMLDSEGALRSATSMSAQRRWLEGALAASTSPWKVVVVHHAPYSSGSENGPTPAMRWPYAEWGADLVLSGHDHDYERLTVDGLTYEVNGLGGTSRYTFGTVSPGSIVRYNELDGATRITATSTSLVTEFVNTAGEVIDRYDVPRPPRVAPEVARFQDGLFPDATYSGTRDATIAQATPTTPFGTSTELRVDGDDPPRSGQDLSSVLRWDLSALPPAATVTKVQLVLDVANTTTEPYSVAPLLGAWNEAEVSWNLAATGQPWSSPGAVGAADRGAVIGTWSFPAAGRSTIDLGAAGVALVQGWVSGSMPNHGLILASTSSADGMALASRESSVATSRPMLVITYLPAPTQLAPAPFAKLAPADDAVEVERPVTLSWAGAAHARRYEYCLTTSSAGFCDTGWVPVGRATSVVLDELAQGTTYSWQVRAVNGAGMRRADRWAWWSFGAD